LDFVSDFEIRISNSAFPEGIPVRTKLLALLVATGLPIALLPLSADEGMWLFNRPPRDLLKKKFDFELTDAWLQKSQKASVRFNSGGSGGFVSPEGLVITNHHIAADTLIKLSTKDKDLHAAGFYAATRDEELKCPDLELNVLQEVVDVTTQVAGAVKPGMSAADAAVARGAAIAKIAKDSLAQTGLRSDVVTLYRGAEYHLYRYKKYTDVRLVFAPEYDIAFFGGDADNFEFPRTDLDVSFFRVYEDGKPARTPDYFPWSAKGPAEGDLVFVTGHPGTTNRLETLDHLKHRRDVTLPYLLRLYRQREALLLQYAQKNPEAKRQAQQDLFGVANSRKVFVGQHLGLLDPAVLAAKAAIEKDVRSPAGPAGKPPDDGPWVRVAGTLKELAGFERRYMLLEKGDAFDSRLFRIARHLVRLSEELPKPDALRLSEYHSAGLDSLKLQLLSPAPISDDLERAKLAGSLAFLAENLGGEDPVVVKVLAGKSPEQRAAELIAGTKLQDVAERKRLLEAGKAGIAASTDALVGLALLVEPEARALRQRFQVVDEVQKQAYAGIARATFNRFGAAVAPDATFSLRLALGVVKGYAADGIELPYTTTFADAFARAAEHNNEEPFRLPKRWLEGKEKLDLTTPFNFVSTADTIGGNSGSPVINRAGELVGINFDRNRHGLVRNFVYTEVQARHISVHSRAVLEALGKLYHADALLRELGSGQP
jgi:hypothetical protein